MTMPKRKEVQKRDFHGPHRAPQIRQKLEEAFERRCEDVVEELDRALVAKNADAYTQALIELMGCERLLRSLIFHASRGKRSGGVRERRETRY